MPDDYQDTIQCDRCASIVYVVTRRGTVVSARLQTLDLDVPAGLPSDLQAILMQAVACYEIGSSAGTVVLAGLFLEGLLQEAGITGDRLVDMIEQAHKAQIVSTLGFHVATASRLIRNIGAHYSTELVRLGPSDARLVLEMARKLAADIVESGRLKKG
ncbi:MAG: DUF4145 domain-containing protein [Candidatus Rokuibacteriota bacterium]